MKIKRILWAHDGSKESLKSLKVAECLAHLFDSKILGLYVNSIFYPITPNYTFYVGYIEEAAEEINNDFVEKFKILKKDLKKRNINFNGKVVRGEIEKTVNKIANKEKADLIIIGNTGKNLLVKMLIGSDSLKILRKSNLPVLTVPSFVKNTEFNLNKILVPIDISDKNINSLKFAINLALKSNISITVLYVLSLANNFMDYPPGIEEQIIKGVDVSLGQIVSKAKEIFNKAVLNQSRNNNFNGLKLKIRKKQLVDLQTALKITEYANKNKFDLILINSHNKGKIEKFFLGSVTEEVVRNSKIPVVSIKTFKM